MEFFGIDAKIEEDVIEIDSEIELSFSVFLRLWSQWRWGAMGGCLGIEYTSIPVVMDMMDVKKKNRSQVFQDIQVMESAALKILNKDTQNGISAKH